MIASATCIGCGRFFAYARYGTEPERRYHDNECRLQHVRRDPAAKREAATTWQRTMRAKGCSARDCDKRRVHPSRPWCTKHSPASWRLLRKGKARREWEAELLARVADMERISARETEAA